jgi:hypothetical protein
MQGGGASTSIKQSSSEGKIESSIQQLHHCVFATFVNKSGPPANIFRESELYNLILILIMYLVRVGYY